VRLEGLGQLKNTVTSSGLYGLDYGVTSTYAGWPTFSQCMGPLGPAVFESKVTSYQRSVGWSSRASSAELFLDSISHALPFMVRA
jgi:hypothetical protein